MTLALLLERCPCSHSKDEISNYRRLSLHKIINWKSMIEMERRTPDQHQKIVRIDILCNQNIPQTIPRIWRATKIQVRISFFFFFFRLRFCKKNTSKSLRLKVLQSRMFSKTVSTLSMMTTGMQPFRMLSSAREEYPSPAQPFHIAHMSKAVRLNWALHLWHRFQFTGPHLERPSKKLTGQGA